MPIWRKSKKREMMTPLNDQSERELKIIRKFKYPIALVWEMWTDPQHLVNWWGPNGFTTTIHQMEVKVGAEWLLTMKGPDGKTYPNRSVFLEVVPFEKISYEHFNPSFIATALFREIDGETELEWTMVFPTKELCEAVVKAHGAAEGLKQNVEKLDTYLSLQPQNS